MSAELPTNLPATESMKPNGFEEVHLKDGQAEYLDLAYCEPFVAAEDGFMVGGLEADLVGIIAAGDQNKIGIARTKLVGSEKVNTLLVRLESNQGKIEIPNNSGGRPSALELNTGSEVTVGRKEEIRNGSLAELELEEDFSMSSGHMKIELQDDESVLITDLHSRNGTSVVFGTEERPGFNKEEASRYTSEALRDEVQTGLGLIALKSEVVTGTLTLDDIAETGYYVDNTSLVKILNDANEMIEQEAPKEAVEILLKGAIDGFGEADSTELARNGRTILDGRRKLAKIYIENPDVAKFILSEKIVGFHGTRSSALAGMLEQGALLSAAEAKRRGIAHTTGEHVFQKADGQESISFSVLGFIDYALKHSGGESRRLTQDEVREQLQKDREDIAKEINELPRVKQWMKESYQAIKKDNDKLREEFDQNPNALIFELMQNDFPVLLAINQDAVLDTAKNDPSWNFVKDTASNLGEFRPKTQELDLDDLVMIVPEDYVRRVEELLVEHGKKTKVLPLDPIERAVA